MRLILLCLSLVFLSFPISADDTPDIIEVAHFGRGTAYTLAWRPDGEVLAVSSSTGVWFFDEDFNELGRLAEGTSVYHLEWSPDGKRLIAFDSLYKNENCQIFIWNVSLNLQTISQDKLLDLCALSVDWSTNGEMIAFSILNDIVTEDTTIVIYSTRSYTVLHEYQNVGLYMAFSNDSKFLATGGISASVKIIELQLGNYVQEIFDKQARGQPLWSPDDNYVVTKCFDDTLFQYYGDGNCIWNTVTGELVFGTEPSIIWNPKQNTFLKIQTSFWGSPDRATFIELHQDFSGEAIANTFFPDTINNVVWHPSGEFFTTLAIGQGISQFDGQSGKLIAQHGLFQPVWGEIIWIPETSELLTISSPYYDQNSTVQVWSIDSNDKYKPERNQLIRDVDEIQWIDDSYQFIVHSKGGMGYYWTNIWDVNTLEHVETIYEHFDQQHNIPTYRFSSNMHRIATYNPDYRDNIEIIDSLHTHENPVEIAFQTDRTRQIEWSPDNSMIATAGNVGDSYFLIDIWDASTGEKISTIQRGYLQHYDSFYWSPDSSQILVVGERVTGVGATSRFLTLYDVGRDYNQWEITQMVSWYEDVHDIPNHLDVTWSPNGQIVAISFNTKIRFYDVESKELITTIDNNTINGLDWHESGQYLAGGASDGTIYVWDVSALLD